MTTQFAVSIPFHQDRCRSLHQNDGSEEELITPIRSTFIIDKSQGTTGQRVLGISLGSSGSTKSSFGDGFDSKVLASSRDQDSPPLPPSSMISHTLQTSVASTAPPRSQAEPRLTLESPFKSPGWRMREMEKMQVLRSLEEGEDDEEEVLEMRMEVGVVEQGSRGDVEREGGTARLDQEVPMLSKTLSDFSISRPTRSLAQAPSNPTNHHDVIPPFPASPSPFPPSTSTAQSTTSLLTSGSHRADTHGSFTGHTTSRPPLRLRTSTAPPFLLSMSGGGLGNRARGQEYGMGFSRLKAQNVASPVSPTPGPQLSQSIASTSSIYQTPYAHPQPTTAQPMQPSDSLSPREWERARSKTTPPRWTSRFGQGFDGMEACAPGWLVNGGGLGGLASPFSSGGPNAKGSRHAHGDSFSYAYRSGNGRIGANGYEYEGGSGNANAGTTAEDTIDEARERVEKWARETYPQITVPGLATEDDQVEIGRGLNEQDRLTPGYNTLCAPGFRSTKALAGFASSNSIDSSSAGSGLGFEISHRGSPSPSPLAGHQSSMLGLGSRYGDVRGPVAFSPAKRSPLRQHQRMTSGNSSIDKEDRARTQSQSSPVALPSRLPLHPSLAQPVFFTQERVRPRKRGGSVKSPDLERGPDSGMMLGYFDGVETTGTSFEEEGTGLIKTARIRSATTPHASRVLMEDMEEIQGRRLFETTSRRKRASTNTYEDVDMVEQLDSPVKPGLDSPVHSRTSSRNGQTLSEPSAFAVASAMVSENGSPISRKKSSLPLRLDAGPNTITLNSPDAEQLAFMPRSPSDPLMNVPRPLFRRQFTDPTGSRPSTPAALSFATISESSGSRKAAWRKTFHSGLDLQSERMSTPVQAFEMERPSPAAFMSTGLVKKGSGYLNNASSGPSSAPPGSGIKRARSITLQKDVSRTPDTPVKANAGKPTKALEMPVLKMKIHPLRFGEVGIGGVEGKSPPAEAAVDVKTTALGMRSRGLRRKGSRMWQRTDSGNYSNGSTIGDGFSLEEEPETPTRPDNAGVVRLDFATHTPSPPTLIHSYPFAVSSNDAQRGRNALADSPSPPKKNTLLSRLQYSGKHRALSRISNPLLNAAYKLGEQQSSRKSSGKANVVDKSRQVSLPQDVLFERDFTLLEPLGQGEFSTVWKVKDKKDGRMYAVKRNKPFIGEKDRLRQWEEVNIMRLLSVTPNHHIMRFHDAWEEKQQLHIKTGLAECGDLAGYLQSVADDGGLDEGRVWKLLAELASGLRHIHSFDVLHLDLKPSNILLDRDGSVRIADFGLSTRLSIMSSPAIDRVARSNASSGASKDSIREGDREYMSPETLHGHFSKAADVYNLGITILESAMNVVLPSNGEAWQKLRSDDFTDLDEHLLPQTLLASEPSTQSIGNLPSLSSTAFGTSVSSTASTNTLGGPLISDTLVHLIKRMMDSDPLQRHTMEQVWHHPVVRRVRLGEIDNVQVRTSTDSQSRSSVDGWETWARQKGCGGGGVAAMAGGDVKPALVPEEHDFLASILGV